MEPHPFLKMKKNMKTLGISHDFAHCNGDGCEKKDKCVRYLLHLEVKEKADEFITYVAPIRIGDECGCYWEYRQEEYENKKV